MGRGGIDARRWRARLGRREHTGRLAWALGLMATYMFAEFAGSLITGSLAMLADAAHMLTDVAGLALALIAIRFAAREPTSKLTTATCGWRCSTL